MQDHDDRRRSETIQAFIRFDRIALVLAIVAVVGINLAVLRVSAVFLAVPILLVLIGALTAADIVCGRGRIAPALGLIGAGHWFVALTVVWLFPFLWPVLTLTVLMPLVLATPLLSSRSMIVAIGATTGVVAVVASLGLLLDDAGVIEDIPDELELVVVIGALAAQVVPIALITRHNNRLQTDALAEATGLNRALRQSERALARSRRRLTEVSDEERRRLERDLHDGPQQRLLAMGMKMRLMRSQLPEGDGQVATDDAVSELEAAIGELRELAHGIYPPLLQSAGLPGALRALARSFPLPVETSIEEIGRRDETVEASCWFIVREALANITKHSHAENVWIELRSTAGDGFTVEVSDDGVGLGAGSSVGVGAVGIGIDSMRDRAAVIGATLEMESRAGGGVVVRVQAPGAADVGPTTGAHEFHR